MVGPANGRADALGSLVVIKGLVDLATEISTSTPEVAYAYSIKDKNGDLREKGVKILGFNRLSSVESSFGGEFAIGLFWRLRANTPRRYHTACLCQPRKLWQAV